MSKSHVRLYLKVTGFLMNILSLFVFQRFKMSRNEVDVRFIRAQFSIKISRPTNGHYDFYHQ